MKRGTLNYVFVVIFLILHNTHAQDINIEENTVSLPTYDFGKGNPVPILGENSKIFPYFKFEAYEHAPQNKDWKVVTIENAYIKVMVLPEIGGKVWGAIEKSTGEEFLYKNEVIKFRNIAMRGPWTSGGIEFNFGIIGHHPATATAVDYTTQTNKDGSVSCIVSNTDLPSNTRWTVEIRLEKDKAYFETNASWYNASPLTESYYNWMTAAAVATNDLEFFIPGNAYVEHNGDAHPWPIDEKGRNLAMYKNNNFGPAKSYHVVGEYNDFFGGYYHDRKFGFGQWSPYEEMPGQKLWLWALSRSGGIWEDLLTDTDGQYIEFQAGRLFDQYFPGATNPISQVGFDPYMMDRWSEIWFPIKEIGGMEDAAEHGVLNVETNNGETTISINALQNINTTLRVVVNGKTEMHTLALAPMEVFTKKISASEIDKIEIYVDGTELSYSNDPEINRIKRPFYPNKNLVISKSEALYFAGCEALEFREFELAHQKLTELTNDDPSHQAGLIKLAELEYRRTNYDIALKHVNSVLQMDTYNADANYIAGISYRAKQDNINALESLGWAARDVKHRSVAFAQMAEIYLVDKQLKRARTYAKKALDFNTYNLNAREVLLVLHRLIKDQKGFTEHKNALSKIDPLNHFVAMEEARMNNYKDSSDIEVIKNIKNEFQEESALAIALRYTELGFEQEALLSLLNGKKSVKNELWKSYLQKDIKADESKRLLDKALNAKVNFVFPYRRETIPVLEWAINQNESWKLKYYLAQNYLAVGLKSKGIALLKDLGNIPDADVFYRFRSKMSSITNEKDNLPSAISDLDKALQLNPNDWKVWEEIILLNHSFGDFDSAYTQSKKAYKKYTTNYNIGLAHAKSLLNTQRFNEVLKILKTIQVLPYEHASESRDIFKRAHMGVAAQHINKKNYKKALAVLQDAKEWPENIGVGKPFSPDERALDFFIAAMHEQMGQTQKRNSTLNKVLLFTEENLTANSTDHFFGLMAAKKLNRNSDGIIEQLLQTTETHNKSQLALKLFNNNTSDFSTLKNKELIPIDVLNMLMLARTL